MKRLVCSFSMGETSAFMTKWCLDNLKNEFDQIIVVLANVGLEDEESLSFAKKCDDYFNFQTVWVEAVINPDFGEGVEAKIVDYYTASRNGEPFEAYIQKFGIPNANFPGCSRDLKSRTIKSYLKSIGWDEYRIAIGIRQDEPSRLNWDKKGSKISRFYPLAERIKITKPHVNLFFEKQPFRLGIKSYEGNCRYCYKKSKRKLMTLVSEDIASNNMKWINWVRKMEKKYGEFIPETRSVNVELPLKFFRDHLSIDEIIEDSLFPFDPAVDERYNLAVQFSMWDKELDEHSGCSASCEPFQEDDF